MHPAFGNTGPARAIDAAPAERLGFGIIGIGMEGARNPAIRQPRHDHIAWDDYFCLQSHATRLRSAALTILKRPLICPTVAKKPEKTNIYQKILMIREAAMVAFEPRGMIKK